TNSSNTGRRWGSPARPRAGRVEAAPARVFVRCSKGESPAMTGIDENRQENRGFEGDVAKLLHPSGHSVHSDKEGFRPVLISNAADACDKLRYEAIASPELLGDDPTLRITLLIDADNKCLTVEDNGIGMSREEMVQGLGTIAHSGTKAFLDRIEAAQSGEGA